MIIRDASLLIDRKGEVGGEGMMRLDFVTRIIQAYEKSNSC
jgi:hypothetical protein